MKKIGVLLIALLLLTTLVLAQEVNLEDKSSKKNDITDKKITIPKILQPLTKTIFGIENNILLSTLIIQLLFWLVIATAFIDIFYSYSAFSKIPSIVIAIAISIIAALLGVLQKITQLSMITIAKIKYIGDINLLSLIFTILIILILFTIFHRINTFFRHKKEIGKAKEEGFEAGESWSFMKAARKMFTKLGKD